MENKIFKIIFVIAILVRIVYLTLTPPGQLPDEKFHLKRIWSSIYRPSTIFFPDKQEFYYNNNEYYYPPLYFLASSIIIRPVALSFSGSNIVETFNLSIYILRFLSLIAITFSLALIWKILAALTSNSLLKISAFSFMALIPSLSSFSVAANPNNLSFFLITAFIYILISKKGGNYVKTAIFSGAVFGLAVLTKSDSLAAFPFILYLFPLKKEGKAVVKTILFFLFVSFLFGGWWYVVNLIKYGGLYNKRLFLYSVEDWPIPIYYNGYLSFIITSSIINFFASFGAYNNIYLNTALYIPLLSLTLVAWLGLLYRAPKNFINKKGKIMLYLPFLISFLVNVYIFLIINLRYCLQTQGRYFFNSAIFISLAWVGGLMYSLPRKIHKIVPAVIVSYLLFLNILGFGCNLQYFYNSNLLPESVSCTGSYLPVGKIEADIAPK